MAQTRTGYVAIDDTRVDAESPLTESLITEMRDQWYAALAVAATAAPDSDRLQAPERMKHTAGALNAVLQANAAGGFLLALQSILSHSTTDMDTTKVLRPNGSGGVGWGADASPATKATKANGVSNIASQAVVASTWYALCLVSLASVSGSTTSSKVTFSGKLDLGSGTAVHEFIVEGYKPTGGTSWVIGMYDKTLNSALTSSSVSFGNESFRINTNGSGGVQLEFQTSATYVPALASFNVLGNAEATLA